MKRITLLCLSIMMSMVFTSSNLAQDLLYEVPLSEQVEVSSQIVEGKVISKNSFWDVNQQQIYTVNTVEVYKVFKGEALSTIEVVTLGGRVGDVGLMVTPSLVLQKDDVGLFLLQDSDVELTSSSVVPRYKSNSSVQGFFKYNIYDNLATSPFSIKNGITSELYNDITELTNSTYTSVSSFNIDNQIDFLNAQRAAGGIAINSFSPTTISGGTKSILTIEGAGFGTTPGAVLFRDANDGGASLYPALDSQIISWTNTQIQVEVPSRAGTGTIRVVDPIGFNVTSSTPLTIAFSEINYSDGVNAFQTQHIDQNSNGGYTWSMHIEFNNNSAAAAAASELGLGNNSDSQFSFCEAFCLYPAGEEEILWQYACSRPRRHSLTNPDKRCYTCSLPGNPPGSCSYLHWPAWLAANLRLKRPRAAPAAA